MEKLKLAVVGCGHLGSIIAEAYTQGFLEEYQLVGVLGRTKEKAKLLAGKTGCRACETMEELLALKPDYVAEAASVQWVKDCAQKVLGAGSSLIVLSIGAFADEPFYRQIQQTARENGRRVYIASGAIGGFDVLRTISLMGQVSSKIETRKGPASLKGTPLFEETLMEDSKPAQVFAGTAKEAIALLPTKVNVAVAASLATAGAEHTGASICSVPGMAGDDHKITAAVDGVQAMVDVYSRTSDIAAWSVVALLRNLVSPIVF